MEQLRLSNGGQQITKEPALLQMQTRQMRTHGRTKIPWRKRKNRRPPDIIPRQGWCLWNWVWDWNPNKRARTQMMRQRRERNKLEKQPQQQQGQHPVAAPRKPEQNPEVDGWSGGPHEHEQDILGWG